LQTDRQTEEQKDGHHNLVTYCVGRSRMQALTGRRTDRQYYLSTYCVFRLYRRKRINAYVAVFVFSSKAPSLRPVKALYITLKCFIVRRHHMSEFRTTMVRVRPSPSALKDSSPVGKCSAPGLWEPTYDYLLNLCIHFLFFRRIAIRRQSGLNISPRKFNFMV